MVELVERSTTDPRDRTLRLRENPYNYVRTRGLLDPHTPPPGGTFHRSTTLDGAVSNQRAHRRRHRSARNRGPAIDRSTVELVASASARARGCTCSPDLRVRHLGPGIMRATVAHDPGCPALREEHP